MLSAVTALFVILPIMWFAIGDRRLFLAALPPTILPVVATLGFMGLCHITVRIGTAMILAIALGLAADDTVHLSVRIRDRIRSGCDPQSAVSATLLRTGRPCSFSSYVLIGGFGSMMASSLIALREMGLIAMFTMAFALATDVVLGPALYLLLKPKRVVDPAAAEGRDAATPAVVPA
jgi:predicted RND superfamily exporter protein